MFNSDVVFSALMIITWEAETWVTIVFSNDKELTLVEILAGKLITFSFPESSPEPHAIKNAQNRSLNKFFIVVSILLFYGNELAELFEMKNAWLHHKTY